jgi:hypothetical protein
MASQNKKDAAVAQHVEALADQEHNITAVEATMIADEADHAKPSLWTVSMLRLYGCLFIGYLCATMNGFDGSVMGLVLGPNVSQADI